MGHLSVVGSPSSVHPSKLAEDIARPGLRRYGAGGVDRQSVTFRARVDRIGQHQLDVLLVAGGGAKSVDMGEVTMAGFVAQLLPAIGQAVTEVYNAA
ncbi:hypothetical protein [Luteibacter sp. 9133]|uniref:hypothetical protein n=1 Tax=Luteibacter sp. 9133 TaxID=1500891 RepID=UPI0005B7786A|nr:hypothetical protein [Luteibacter sp. 9133]